MIVTSNTNLDVYIGLIILILTWILVKGKLIMILTTQCNAVTTHKELSREPPHIDIVVLETVLVLKV